LVRGDSVDRNEAGGHVLRSILTRIAGIVG
jgi:hypothetical protein